MTNTVGSTWMPINHTLYDGNDVIIDPDNDDMMTAVPSCSFELSMEGDYLRMLIKTHDSKIIIPIICFPNHLVAAYCMDRDMRQVSDDPEDRLIARFMNVWLPYVEALTRRPILRRWFR